MNSQLTVLMTVHNGGQYLGPAIESILYQTYRDFRYLIVDDASTDDTREVVRSYDDRRIELLCLDQNVGQTAALNIGLRHISTPWVARMDADDYSAPTRFEEQMLTVGSDDSLTSLGTYAWTFTTDPQAADGEILTPISHVDIKRRLLRGSPLIHASMVAKRCALLEVGAYNERYRYAADVDLYDRLLRDRPAANLPAKLYGVRQHPGQGTRTLTAMNEIIEIHSLRLTANDYAPWEKKVVRSSLARAQVDLARRLGSEGNTAEMTRTLLMSLKSAPRTFAWYFPAVFIGYSLPAGVRNSLKGMFMRAVSTIKT